MVLVVLIIIGVIAVVVIVIIDAFVASVPPAEDKTRAKRRALAYAAVVVRTAVAGYNVMQ
jgi:glucose uptake protein GlcU